MVTGNQINAEASPTVLPASRGQAAYAEPAIRHRASCNINLGIGIDLPADTDVQVVRRAIALVSARHESLRTTFAVSGGNVCRVVAPFGSVTNATVRQLHTTPPSGGELSSELLNEPFDLEVGPAIRCALAEGDRALRMVVVLHHSMADAAACTLLADELVRIFRGGRAAEPPNSAQFCDFVAAERRLETPERRSWWAGQLRRHHDLPVLLQGRRTASHGELTVVRGAEEIPSMAHRILRARALSLGSGILSLLTATIVRSLADHRRREIRVGLGFLNRPPRMRAVVGLLTDILPLRVACHARTPLGDVARDLHRALWSSARHRMPLGAIMRCRDDRNPELPFEVHVNYLPASVLHPAPSAPMDLPAVANLGADRRATIPQGFPFAPLRFKLVEQVDGALAVICECAGGVFTRGELEDLASLVVHACRRVT